MKALTVDEFRDQLDSYLDAASSEEVLLPRSGQAIAVLKLTSLQKTSLDASELRQLDRHETRLWQAAADRVLKELWDNDEDAIYDEI